MCPPAFYQGTNDNNTINRFIYSSYNKLVRMNFVAEGGEYSIPKRNAKKEKKLRLKFWGSL